MNDVTIAHTRHLCFVFDEQLNNSVVGQLQQLLHWSFSSSFPLWPLLPRVTKNIFFRSPRYHWRLITYFFNTKRGSCLTGNCYLNTALLIPSKFTIGNFVIFYDMIISVVILKLKMAIERRNVPYFVMLLSLLLKNIVQKLQRKSSTAIKIVQFIFRH